MPGMEGRAGGVPLSPVDQVMSASVGEFGQHQKTLSLLLSLCAMWIGAHTVQIVFTTSMADNDQNMTAMCNNGTHSKHALFNTGQDKQDKQTAADQQTSTSPPGEVTSSAVETLMTNQSDVVRRRVRRGTSSDGRTGSPPHNTSAEQDACRQIVRQSSGQFQSIAHTWPALQDDVLRLKAMEIGLFSGILTGAVVFGVLSDIFGRIRPLAVAILLSSIATLCSAFSPNYDVLFVLEFFNGVGMGGMNSVGYGLAVELVGVSYRVFSSTVYKLSLPLGMAVCAAVIQFTPTWRHLMMSLAAMSIPIYVVVFLVPESPRWLLARGRPQDAEDVLAKMATKNKKTFKKGSLVDSELPPSKRETPLSVVTSPILRHRTLAMLMVALSIGLTNYLFIIAAQDFGYSVIVNESVMAVFKLMGSVVAFSIQHRMGCRTAVAGTMAGSIVPCAIIFLMTHPVKALETTLASMGMLMITIAHISSHLYMAELYPTTVRSSALGLITMATWGGATLSPVVSLLHLYVINLDFALCGALCVLGTMLTLSLPDTTNCALAETLADLHRQENIGSADDYFDIDSETENKKKPRQVKRRTFPSRPRSPSSPTTPDKDSQGQSSSQGSSQRPVESTRLCPDNKGSS